MKNMCFVLALIIVSVVSSWAQPVSAADSTDVVAVDSLETDVVKTVKIVGVGDVMPGSDFPDRKKFPANGGKNLIQPELEEIIRNADVAFCNLEGSVADGLPTKEGKKYAFRIPSSLAANLATWGFDLVSMANNHAGDCEEEGRQSTIKALDELGLTYSGSKLTPAGVTLERDGIEYGFIAVAPNKGCHNFHNTDLINREIRSLDEKCDIVIVSIHGGAEGKGAEHLTREVETYMGENRGNIYELAHGFIDSGADIVFGHGPHVTRAIECYQGRLIAYSLGNFCTHGGFNLEGVNGIAPLLIVEVDRAGKLVSGEIVSIRQNWPGGPVLDGNVRVLHRIMELTEQDLDGGGLEFRGKFFFPAE